jgi:hypothetical protein
MNNKRKTKSKLGLIIGLLLTSAILTTTTTTKANSWELTKQHNKVLLSGASKDYKTLIDIVCYPSRVSIIITGTGYDFGHYSPGFHWISENQKHSGILNTLPTATGGAIDSEHNSVNDVPVQLLLNGLANNNEVNFYFNTKNGEINRRLNSQNVSPYLSDFIQACDHL